MSAVVRLSRIRAILLGLFLLITAGLQLRYSVTLINLLLHGDQTPEFPANINASDLLLFDILPPLNTAGAKSGDRLLAIGGEPIRSRIDYGHQLLRHRAGEEVSFRLQRGNSAPFDLRIRLKAQQEGGASLRDFAEVGVIGLLTPWFCLLLGYFVALRRPYDPPALALLVILWWISQIFRTNAHYELGWEPLFSIPSNFLGPFVALAWPLAWLWFGLTFPDPHSPHRIFPAARWIFGIPLLLFASMVGVMTAGIAHARDAFLPLEHWDDWIPAWFVYVMVIVPALLGAVNLIYKMAKEPHPTARRKLRFLLAGIGVGLSPLLTMVVLSFVLKRSMGSFGQGPLLFAAIMVFVVPATMAYVVVVQKAMDVGIAVRQGLQYAFAANTLLAIRIVLIVLLLSFAVEVERSHYLPPAQRYIVIPVCVAGIFLVRRGGDWVRRKVDRRFFREAVNAEQVLHELGEEVHRIADPQQLLRTVSDRIAHALHVPRVVALLDQGGVFQPAYAHGFDGIPPQVMLHQTSPTIQDLQTRRTALPVKQGRDDLGALDSELLLPLAAKNHLLGVLSLGPKQSEQPYSQSDLRLLQAVAAQTGLALENSRLTAAVAEEAAHRERIHRELEIAGEVQQRLFPKAPPHVPGLDLAGACRPAQTVGGDYYDFLQTPDGQIGLAIGDVSGKGFPAALLMASLQASLRAMTLAGVTDLGDLMTKLNRLIYDATPASRFATFFYGLYDPQSGVLSYSSAGHNPALLLRADGACEWLKTSGVGLGLARRSQYDQGQVVLQLGDRLILYTDGVTEAMNESGEEFGEERLIATCDGTRNAAQLMTGIMDSVKTFAGSAPQHDDITLIVARRT